MSKDNNKILAEDELKNIENISRVLCERTCSCETCRNKNDCGFKNLLTTFYNCAKERGIKEAKLKIHN